MIALAGVLLGGVVFISGCTQLPQEPSKGYPSITTTENTEKPIITSTTESTIALPEGSSAGKIAFTSGGSVYVINYDGTGKLNLAKGGGVLGWSLDGKRIFYKISQTNYYSDSRMAYTNHYYAANFDGTGITDLGETGFPNEFRKPGKENLWSSGPLEYSATDYPKIRVLSPDGKMVAYIESYDLVVKNNGTGSDAARVKLREAEWFSDFSWSPDGKEILYNVVGTGYELGYHVINIETGKLNYIDYNHYPPNSGVFLGISSPQWSPDGKNLLYLDQDNLKSGDPRSQPKYIYAINADGTGKIYIGEGQNLAWSSDSKKIVYTSLSSNEQDEYNIYVVNADGTGKINLGEGYDAVPSPATQ